MLSQFSERSRGEHQVPPHIPLQRIEHVPVGPGLLYVGLGQEACEGMDIPAEAGQMEARRREGLDVL